MKNHFCLNFWDEAFTLFIYKQIFIFVIENHLFPATRWSWKKKNDSLFWAVEHICSKQQTKFGNLIKHFHSWWKCIIVISGSRMTWTNKIKVGHFFKMTARRCSPAAHVFFDTLIAHTLTLVIINTLNKLYIKWLQNLKLQLIDIFTTKFWCVKV